VCAIHWLLSYQSHEPLFDLQVLTHLQDVQRYVRMIMKSGDDFRLRWAEQAVQSMVWLIFVPKKHVELLPIKATHPSTECF